MCIWFNIYDEIMAFREMFHVMSFNECTLLGVKTFWGDFCCSQVHTFQGRILRIRKLGRRNRDQKETW